MKVDLSTCVPGQKLKSRGGESFTFVYKHPNNRIYPYHIVLDSSSIITSRTLDGKNLAYMETESDIVEILPMKKEKNNLVKQLMSRLEEAKTELDVIAAERVKINKQFDNCASEIEVIENLLKIKRKIFDEKKLDSQ